MLNKTVNVVDDTAAPDALICMADEDGLTVDAWLEGRAVRNDYGVPGSPVWYDVEDVVVDRFEINGVVYTPKEAEARFGKDAVNALWEMAVEADDGEGWE
jgi:hypothetical protein